jgi:ATP-binding protein involved in chromosome partitioning
MSHDSVPRAHLVQKAWAAVAAVRDPELGVSLGKLGMVRGVELSGTTVIARIALTIPGCPMKERIARDVAAALGEVEGVDGVEVRFDAMSEAQQTALVSRLRGDSGEHRFAGGRTSVVAIASGKGGVGKSTVTVNIACALAAAGQQVGILDADVWGFSVPRMLGLDTTPVGLDGMLLPVQAHGVKVMSVGLFAEQRSPVIWRGPLLHGTMRQFVEDVHWGELDVLLCDLPPGTGDVPISLAQMIPDAGVVVVTTPQESAHTVAQRAGRMATKSRLRVLGVVENMASFVCPCCGQETEIFGSGGGETLAHELGVPLLARVPVATPLRVAGDCGVPLVVSDPDAPASVALRQAADALMELARPSDELPIVRAAGAVTSVSNPKER